MGQPVLKLKMKRITNIFKDLYYRLCALPLLFALWIILCVWKRRIGKYELRLARNREKMDLMWLMIENFEGKRYKSEKIKLTKFEKEFLNFEEELKNDIERCEKRKALFKKYLGKLLDPTIGH